MKKVPSSRFDQPDRTFRTYAVTDTEMWMLCVPLVGLLIAWMIIRSSKEPA